MKVNFETALRIRIWGHSIATCEGGVRSRGRDASRLYLFWQDVRVESAKPMSRTMQCIHGSVNKSVCTLFKGQNFDFQGSEF